MARDNQAARRYTETHPWITFGFDLNKLTEFNWMRLGESISKGDHIAGVPLPPAVAESLHMLYLVKGVHATTEIEGNTLSEHEVSERLRGNLKLPESQEYLGIEADNVHDAIEMILRDLVNGVDMSMTPERIKSFNKIVLRGLPPEEGVVPGEFREASVLVGNVYRGAPAEDCPYLAERLCDWLANFLEGTPERYHAPLKIIRAVLAHLYLAWIHPFGNGNGRVARLMEFQLLIEAGLPTPACHLLTNYYSRTKPRYYAALRETSRNPTYPVEHFLTYALDGLVEELREQLKKIRDLQIQVSWVNYVHEICRSHARDSDARARQRHLVLALNPREVKPRAELRRLTPWLAEKYATKSDRVVSHDIGALERLGLIEVTKAGVRPRIELMSAFLPLRVQDN